VVHPVRTGDRRARVVVLTNAAGGLDPAMKPGQAVLIRDHLNLMGASPLSGPAPPAGYRARFVDLTDLYPAKLRALAGEVDPALTEGVYAALGGPHFETPAEVAMLRRTGADLVGMSTALEAIAAHHLGRRFWASRSSPTWRRASARLRSITRMCWLSVQRQRPTWSSCWRRADAAVTVGHEKAEPVSAALAAEAEAWMAADPDPSTRTELAALLEAGTAPRCGPGSSTRSCSGLQGFVARSVPALPG